MRVRLPFWAPNIKIRVVNYDSFIIFSTFIKSHNLVDVGVEVESLYGRIKSPARIASKPNSFVTI